jgi:hypothetical protein
VHCVVYTKSRPSVEWKAHYFERKCIFDVAKVGAIKGKVVSLFRSTSSYAVNQWCLAMRRTSSRNGRGTLQLTSGCCMFLMIYGLLDGSVVGYTSTCYSVDSVNF